MYMQYDRPIVKSGEAKVCVPGVCGEILPGYNMFHQLAHDQPHYGRLWARSWDYMSEIKPIGVTNNTRGSLTKYNYAVHGVILKGQRWNGLKKVEGQKSPVASACAIGLERYKVFQRVGCVPCSIQLYHRGISYAPTWQVCSIQWREGTPLQLGLSKFMLILLSYASNAQQLC